jgi:hypothetical protein
MDCNPGSAGASPSRVPSPSKVDTFVAALIAEGPRRSTLNDLHAGKRRCWVLGGGLYCGRENFGPAQTIWHSRTYRLWLATRAGISSSGEGKGVQKFSLVFTSWFLISRGSGFAGVRSMLRAGNIRLAAGQHGDLRQRAAGAFCRLAGRTNVLVSSQFMAEMFRTFGQARENRYRRLPQDLHLIGHAAGR